MRPFRPTLWLLTLAVALSASASALGQVKIFVKPQLDPFISVSVAKRINLTLVHADEIDKLPAEVYSRLSKNKTAMANINSGGCAYVVKAEPTVAKAVRCNVDHGVLSVYADKFKYKKIPSIEVFIVCATGLRSITGASSSNILSRGTLRTADLTVTAEFAMAIHLTIASPSVRVVAKNGSEVRLSGSADGVSAQLDGSHLVMRRMTCRSVSVVASAAATARVNASQSLSLTASGRSAITYTSQGASVNAEADATSRITADSLPL